MVPKMSTITTKNAKPAPANGKPTVVNGKLVTANSKPTVVNGKLVTANSKPTVINGKLATANGKQTAANGKMVNGKPAATNGKQANPSFRLNQNVVYPSHGVGKILSVEQQKVGDRNIRLLVIYFEKDRMTLRVPRDSAASRGLRRLSSPGEISKALKTLKGTATIKRMMWSRRAQEYEQKINSGNLISIAEVVRDLHREDAQGQSYSERQLYDQARDRLVREIAAVSRRGSDAAIESIDTALLKRAA